MIQQSQYSSQNSSTFGYLEQKVNNLNKTDFIMKRAIFQTIEKSTKIFVIQESLPYDIKTKIKQKASLNQDFLLGEGGFGSVYLAIHQVLREYFALKISFNLNEEQLDKATNEYIIQSFFYEAYPYRFLKIERVYIQQKEYNDYTVIAGLELALTTLYDYQNLTILKEEEITNIYYQILESILIMHKHQYAHRDIKPQNILYCEKKGWVLSDFGCSMKYNQLIGNYKIKGTKDYLPKDQRILIQVREPQQNSVQMNLFQNDVYAFQTTFIQILFKKLTIIDIQKILENQEKIHPLIDQLYNKSLQEIQSFYIKKQNFIEIQTLDFTIKKKIQNYFVIQNENEKIKSQLNELELYDEEDHFQKFLQFCETCSEENQFFLKLHIMNYSGAAQPLTTDQKLITKPLKKWQFMILQKYLDMIGDLESQSHNYLQYQKFKGYLKPEIQFNYLRCLMKLGKKDEAKNIIDTIQEKAESFDELSVLKYFCFKAKLQGNWLQIQDSFIKKMKHFQNVNFFDEFLDEAFYTIYEKESISEYIKIYQNCTQVNSPWLLHLIQYNYRANNFYMNDELISHIQTNSLTFENVNNISGKQIIKLLKQKGYGVFGIINELNRLSVSYQFSKKYEQALNLYQEQINFIEEFYPSYEYKRDCYLNFSQFLSEINQYTSAIECALSALQLIQKDDYINLIKSMLLIWNCLIYQNKFEQAIKYFDQLIFYIIQCPDCKMKYGIFRRSKYGFFKMKMMNNKHYQKHLQLLKLMVQKITDIQLLIGSNDVKEINQEELKIIPQKQDYIELYKMFLYKMEFYYYNDIKDSLNFKRCFNEIFLQIFKRRNDNHYIKLGLKSMFYISHCSQLDSNLNQSQKMLQTEKYMQAAIIMEGLQFMCLRDQIEQIQPIHACNILGNYASKFHLKKQKKQLNKLFSKLIVDSSFY